MVHVVWTEKWLVKVVIVDPVWDDGPGRAGTGQRLEGIGAGYVGKEERDRHEAERDRKALHEPLARENEKVALTPAHLPSTPAPVRHPRRLKDGRRRIRWIR